MATRLCTLCDSLIDEESAITSYQSNGGKTVITDANGTAHVLMSIRSTAQKLRFRKLAAEVKVLCVPKEQGSEAVEILPTYAPPVFVPTEPPMPPPAPPVEQPQELDNDGMVDAVVYKFDEVYQNGMCRVTERYRSPSLYNLMIDQRDVITEGKLTKDVMVRVFVGPADDGYVIPRARLVSIYAEQF